MIRHLKIRDFRSIRSADLELGRVNVFIGPNGAGKSNILEAVGVLAAAAGRGIDHRSLAERGVRTSLPRMFKAAFARGKTSPSVSIEATLEGPVPVRYKVALGAGDDAASLDLTHEGLWEGGAQVLGRGPKGCKLHRPTDGDARTVVGDPQRTLWDQYGSVCQVSPSTREAMNKLAAFGIYAPETAVMRGTAVERQSRRPLGLSGSGLAGAVFEMLNARDQHTAAAWDRVKTILFLSGWARELIVSQRRADVVPPELATDERVAYFRDRFMKEGRDLLSAFDASEGTLYLAFHATLVAHPATPPWLAVDNVDAGLNPRVVRRLVQYMADIVCDDAPDAGPVCQQLLFTSHQPTALDGLDLFNREHRLFVVSRGKDGATTVRPVAPPPDATRESWAATHGASTLSKLLIDGAIRGALAEVL